MWVIYTGNVGIMGSTGNVGNIGNTGNVGSGVARPRPTRACALPSTFQALPSAAQQTHVIP